MWLLAAWIGRPSYAEESCWSGQYTPAACCDPVFGPGGNSACFGGGFTFETCCRGYDLTPSWRSGDDAYDRFRAHWNHLCSAGPSMEAQGFVAELWFWYAHLKHAVGGAPQLARPPSLQPRVERVLPAGRAATPCWTSARARGRCSACGRSTRRA